MEENKDWIPIQKIEYFVYSRLRNDHILGFIRDVFCTAIEIFGNKGLIEFSGLFKICSPRNPLDHFLFITNQPKLIGTMNSRQKKFINLFSDEKISKSKKREEVNNLKKNQVELLEGWEEITESKTIKFYNNEWYCLEFKLNTYEKTAQLKQINPLPVSPENYPNRGINFSEAIKFICAFFNNKFLHVSDFEWLTSNKQITKLWIDLMDNQMIDFSKILINQDNIHEWRYSSPKVELEILNIGLDRKNDIYKKLDSIKQDTIRIQNIQNIIQSMQTELEDLAFLIKYFSEEQAVSIKNMFEELEELDSKLLKIDWDNELLNSKLNDISSDLSFADFSEKEKLKIKETLNRSDITVKHKLKFMIPLFFLKYEGEIELGNKQKFPTNLKELKNLFLKE